MRRLKALPAIWIRWNSAKASVMLLMPIPSNSGQAMAMVGDRRSTRDCASGLEKSVALLLVIDWFNARPNPTQL